MCEKEKGRECEGRICEIHAHLFYFPCVRNIEMVVKFRQANRSDKIGESKVESKYIPLGSLIIIIIFSFPLCTSNYFNYGTLFTAINLDI